MQSDAYVQCEIADFTACSWRGISWRRRKGRRGLADRCVDAATVETEIEEEDRMLVAEDDEEGLPETRMEMVEVLLFELGS